MSYFPGTNPYFSNYDNLGEQQLIEDLVIESIKIFGENVLFIPRVLSGIDRVFTEDDKSVYNKAIPIEMYIKDALGFGGDGILMKNFGYEIRDQITFTVAKRIFEQEVSAQIRPNEGDLIYFPLNEKCFQVRFVDYKPYFYQLGILPTYDLTCELFEYAGERFNTGVPEIDRIQTDFSTNMNDYALTDEDGTYLTAEDGDLLMTDEFDRQTILDDEMNLNFDEVEANDTPDDLSDDVLVWDPKDPFSEGGKY